MQWVESTRDRDCIQVVDFVISFVAERESAETAEFHGSSYVPYERYILAKIVTSGSTDLKSVI